MISFTKLKKHSLLIVSELVKCIGIGLPVIVYMDKSVQVIEDFFGVVYSGAFYVPIDIAMPWERVKVIMDTLEAKGIVAKRSDEIAEVIKETCTVIYIEDILQSGAA